MAQPETTSSSQLVDIAGTRLHVVSRGRPESPAVIVLHGGPGLDHHEFADYLDPLATRFRLLLVDQRAQGRSDRDVPDDTLTVEQMAGDVSRLAARVGLTGYAVLGHSFGAMVALQHACDAPGAAVGTIVSSGAPSPRFLDGVEDAIASFEHEELRAQIAGSFAAEAAVETPEQFDRLMREQMPWHFADPYDPRIADFIGRSGGTVYAPHVLRVLSGDYGIPDLEDRLEHVPQPLLALAGRYDRTCPAAGSELTAERVPRGELHVFEHSGHMTYVEEQAEYLAVVEDFLLRAFAADAAS